MVRDIEFLPSFGFPFPGFKSSGYFPMIPWMFLYLCGDFFSEIFREHDEVSAEAVILTLFYMGRLKNKISAIHVARLTIHEAGVRNPCYSSAFGRTVTESSSLKIRFAKFDMVGPNAPQEVKDAWMDAAKEVNANGMGIRGSGMMGHISQMMVQRLNKQLKGETENFDLLGNTVLLTARGITISTGIPGFPADWKIGEQ